MMCSTCHYQRVERLQIEESETPWHVHMRTGVEAKQEGAEHHNENSSHQEVDSETVIPRQRISR